MKKQYNHQRQKPGICNACSKEDLPLSKFAKAGSGYSWWCRDCTNEWHREYEKKLKQEVFNHYGTSCVCCGENELVFLAIDHIEGGGSRHRRSVGGPFYRWLKKQGFPEGYQTMCHNCNWAKSHDGCPHQSFSIFEFLSSEVNV